MPKNPDFFVNVKATNFHINNMMNVSKGKAKQRFLWGLGFANKTNGPLYSQVFGGSAGLDYSTDTCLNHVC